MRRDEEFEELRSLLFSIASRILGSVSEAEDAFKKHGCGSSPPRPSRPPPRRFSRTRCPGSRSTCSAPLAFDEKSRFFDAQNVARVLAAMMKPFERIGGTVEWRELNNQPGAVFRDRRDKVVNRLTLDILDGQVQAIRAVINPDKLRHIGPVADTWAILR